MVENKPIDKNRENKDISEEEKKGGQQTPRSFNRGEQGGQNVGRQGPQGMGGSQTGGGSQQGGQKGNVGGQKIDGQQGGQQGNLNKGQQGGLRREEETEDE